MRQDNDENAPQESIPGKAASMSGRLFVVTAFATLVAVAGRVAADADEETLAETFAAIADSRPFYGLSGAGRLASGVALASGAWYLSRTWILRERWASPAVPALFMISGALTTLSGLCAVVLAATLPEAGGSASTLHESLDWLHWLTGVAGFSAAGLALMVASAYQFRVGGRLRLIAPISAVLGGGMQLIWLPDLIYVHQITGSIFFVWLVVIGVMLATGRVERQYRVLRAMRVQ